MPPLTPRRMRPISGGPTARASGPVAVVDLSRRELLERDRQIVARWRLDHRRRVLLVAALAERAVVAVQLARPLGDDDHRGVVGVGAGEQLVDTWLDHRGGFYGSRVSSSRTI